VAWGEFHVLTGIAIQQASEGRWWLALPLAIMSHWPLDDLNIGAVGKIYHGIGTGHHRILTAIARIPIIGGICFVFWQDPKLLICGLSAWLILDHEWLLIPFHKHGYGLHDRMWPAWLHSELGLIPWFIAFALLLSMLILGVLP